MTVIANGTGTNLDVANEGPSFMFILLDFLRTNSSWTVAGSGNNSTGGMGSDVIAAQADLQTTVSWFVLEDPDATLQLLFSRNGANDLTWDIYINPFADYAGGTASTIPTSAGGHTLVNVTNVTNGGTDRMHILCQDGVTTATAGWAMFGHAAGLFGTLDGGMAFVPLVGGDSADTVKWVFAKMIGGTGFIQGNLDGEGAINTVNADVYGTDVAAPGTVLTWACSTFDSQGSPMVPGVSPSDSGNDLLWPCVLARKVSAGNAGFKGVSTFMRWNGTTRAAGETYNSLTRCSFGDVNFEWDGASTPSAS